SSLEVTSSVVRGPSESHALVDSHLRVASDRSGIGLQVLDNAAVKLDGVAILGAWGFGAYVQSSGTLDAHRIFISDTQALKTPGVDGISFAVALTASTSGKATLTDSTITGGSLAGISSGLMGHVTATGVLVRNIGEAVPLGTGAGVSVGQGGTVEFVRGAIDGASAIGVLAVQAGDASVHISDSSVHGTHTGSTGFGHGAVAGPNTSFTIEGTSFFDNAAVGIVLAGGSARVSRSTFAYNPIALHTQDGSFLSSSADESDLAEGELRVTPDTKFVANGSKIGNDLVPLPPDPLN
ncbi:MAG: right-handed parallel beta-helix repeat-containing protein, partial [Polyangiaceae bacterium]